MFEHLTIGKLIEIKSNLREQWQDTGSLTQADYVRFAMAVLELEARLVKSPASRRSEPQEQDVPISIPIEDSIIHTDERPQCDDPDCPCWEEEGRRQDAAERRYIEAGMTERYDSLPWRNCVDYRDC